MKKLDDLLKIITTKNKIQKQNLFKKIKQFLNTS